MKKLLFALIAVLCLSAVWACAETVSVTTEDGFIAALSDDAADEIRVAADITLTTTWITLTKDVIVDAALTYQPAPGDGFFVKSLTIPEGVTMTLTENGSLATVNTYDPDLTIAQIYVLGGTLDAAAGEYCDMLNICFNAGTVNNPPEFPDSVEITRYLWKEADADEFEEAFEAEGLKKLVIQCDCEIGRSLTIPESLTVQVAAVLTVADGCSITGNIEADTPESKEFTYGFVLNGNSSVEGWANNTEWSASKSFLWNCDLAVKATEYDADGHETFIEIIAANGETQYRYIEFSSDAFMEVYCSNYVYGENGFWQYDYDVTIIGEHRLGTEGFIGSGDDMVCVFNEYTLDDGTKEREDWYNSDAYFYCRYAPDGSLTECGTRETYGEQLLKWDITSQDRITVPEGTTYIGKNAFKGVKAKIIVLPASVTVIKTGAIDSDVLVLVPEGAAITARLDRLGLFHAIIS